MKRAIIIMAKYPQAGKVKTRLQPHLSPEKSAALAAAFLQDAVAKAHSVCENVILAYSPPEKIDALRRFFPSQSIRVEQSGRDLGERMFNAFKFAFALDSDSVVMIGTDSPSFPPEFITRAFELLAKADAVLGKCADGGFYLIGLRAARVEIFENVEWSSAKTFEQTARNIKNLGWRTKLLPVWYDVDFPEDLELLQKDLAKNASVAPATLKWLKSFD